MIFSELEINSVEIPGSLLRLDERLIDSHEYVIDFVITEVKTGETNKLNKFWNRRTDPTEIQKQHEMLDIS